MKRFKFEVWIESENKEIVEHQYREKILRFLDNEKSITSKRVIIKGIAKEIQNNKEGGCK